MTPVAPVRRIFMTLFPLGLTAIGAPAGFPEGSVRALEMAAQPVLSKTDVEFVCDRPSCLEALDLWLGNWSTSVWDCRAVRPEQLCRVSLLFVCGVRLQVRTGASTGELQETW